MKRNVNPCGKLSRIKQACAFLIFGGTAAIHVPAQTFTTLANFDSADGHGPTGPLLQGLDGNLYGTTIGGGSFSTCDSGCGTVFKITTSGQLTTLHSFVTKDGDSPGGGLVQAANGDLYGITIGGGYNLCVNGVGCGTIFKITPDGVLTTIHMFSGSDGSSPQAPLLQGADGHLYGTTHGSGAYGGGTLFEITPQGSFTTLQDFVPESSGQSLDYFITAQGADGELYGITANGGPSALGTIFKITLEGTLTTLFSFDAASGAHPDGLILASDGNFYGTTVGGYLGPPVGSAFKITPWGEFTSLVNFSSQNGINPTTLTQGSDGNFYGTALEGGAYNDGTMFRMTPSGALTTLFNFTSFGLSSTYGGVVQGTNGAFYGTTEGGGVRSNCTIFSLSVGLGAFIEIRPDLGQAGEIVEILGNALTGATSVSFNGAPAPFTVISSSSITARVPNGATSGYVHVVTPAGPLSSNVPFGLLPQVRTTE